MMAMENEKLQLTILLQNFDEAWQQGNHSETEQILKDPKLSVDDASELIMVDLEYRWRRYEAGVRESESLPHGLIGYCDICPALDPDNLPLPLIAEEFRARHRWGDQPTTQSYLDEFGPRSGLESLLTNTLRELEKVQLNVLRSGNLVFECRFSRQLVLGRQAANETAPVCLTNARPPKLVFASLSELEISRKQVRLSCEAANHVHITNLSSGVPCTVNPGGILDVGQALKVRLPCSIHVSNFEFRLRTAGQ